ncbi:MAG TPA: bifunctional YncE family protein/alkaline phosphatase family protein [Bacteroidales bacterium]|nr:bifunctional YncE family protein/alkaline phosphatase family protein [Bacteroidales bacterium]HPM86915.1 bifunctional YncE family protein/alkaline phosphatase family protein [Bacteroidales bacterium]HQM69860.1 bifunctional YncE family protein/alkaline phosphatase family protein [Bacteroidales bacterium]
MKKLLFLAIPVLVLSCRNDKTITTLQVPGLNRYCQINLNGESIIPSGRIVKPYGEFIRIAHDPFGLALSPDGSVALAVHDNTLSLIKTSDMSFTEAQAPFEDKGSYMGAAISSDNKTAYLSGGDNGDIIILDLVSLKNKKRVSINGNSDGKNYKDSFTGDIILSKDEKKLYILDQFNFRMVILDLEKYSVIHSIPVGRFPLGIDISPDEKFAYVANTGIFDYPVAPGLNEKNIEEVGLDFPPYGFPSEEAEEGVEIDGRFIPGLGSPHVPEAVSVWTISLDSNKVISKEKTGYRMGAMVEGVEVEGGSSPNSVAAGDKVYVSNATNDNISVLDPNTGKVTDTIRLTIDPRIDSYRGMIPFGIELSNDGSRLYIALSGINAVGVIDTRTMNVLGYIPTGWFPTKLQVSPDDRYLYVVTARGLGSGPNGGKDFVLTRNGTYVGDIMLGTFEKISLENIDFMAATKAVIDNTFREVIIRDDKKNPLPPAPGIRKSPVKHIVYITKENRTFDEVYGELPGARADSSLARYGKNATVVSKDKTRQVMNVNVMPNHQKIAEEFAVSDNFYCDSDASVHGHRWMVGTYPNEWVEINSSMSITRNLVSTAPGRKFVSGSSGAVYPEDYNEAGGMWEHLSRHGISFFNFGLGFEFSGSTEEQWHKFTGIRLGVMFPMPKPLYDRTSRKFATYNTSVPDQFRIDMFEEELQEKWLSGKEEFPSVITMMIPNDHGSSERIGDGYPYKESYMADNDLAVGRVIETLSHSKWWPEMLIIITEDDAQDGRDNVDAHRSLLMMISPWIKRGYVSHTHANFGAILKTIYNICDLKPLNQFDATATLLQDFFTDEPDFTPYQAVMADKRIFDPQKALDPYDKEFRWESLSESPEIDSENDFRSSHREQSGSR